MKDKKNEERQATHETKKGFLSMVTTWRTILDKGESHPIYTDKTTIRGLITSINLYLNIEKGGEWKELCPKSIEDYKTKGEVWEIKLPKWFLKKNRYGGNVVCEIQKVISMN